MNGGGKLTDNLVFNRTKSSTETVTRLNLWGCDVEDIQLCSKMPNLTVLALSVNNVKCLEPLMHCLNLEELYVRKNSIESLQQLEFLRPLKKLRTLWLDENPCCSAENYRLKVLSTLPQLKMLDNRTVTAEELEQAANLAFESAVPKEERDSQMTPPTGRSGTLPRKMSYSVHTDIDDDARLAVEPMMFQSSYGSLSAAQPIPQAYNQNLSQTINTSSPYGSFPGQSLPPPDHNHPLMSLSMHSQLNNHLNDQHHGRAVEHNRQQQIIQHQNAINEVSTDHNYELMSSSLYQPSGTLPQMIQAGQQQPMAQSMTMSMMRPSYQSMNNMQNQQQESDDLCQSWPEFNFDDPPSLTPGRESLGSPDRMPPMNAPSTFLTQQQLSARKRYNRSRSISPSRLLSALRSGEVMSVLKRMSLTPRSLSNQTNSANIIIAITNLLDELDLNGLRVVIDEAQRRIKKVR